MNLCPRQMSDGAESVKRVIDRQSWHNPSRKFLGIWQILLGNSYGGENKASQARRPCPYMVLSFLCMYICVYMHACMCAYIYMYVGLFVWKCVRIYLCVYICMYMEFFVFSIVYR